MKGKKEHTWVVLWVMLKRGHPFTCHWPECGHTATPNCKKVWKMCSCAPWGKEQSFYT